MSHAASALALWFLCANACHAADDAVMAHALDLSHPTISQAVDVARDNGRTAKFVQVEVAEVINPNRYGLTFDVTFRSADAATVRLGTFSLFPADNPGTFIVPTQGKIVTNGTLAISMTVTDTPVANAPLKVTIRKILLIQGK
jgi:hypothetical protein